MDYPVGLFEQLSRLKHAIITSLVLWLLFRLLYPVVLFAGPVNFGSLHAEDQQNQVVTTIPVFAEINPHTAFAGDQIIIRIIGRVKKDTHLYSIKPQGEFAPRPTKLIVNTRFLKPFSATVESPTDLVIDDAYEMPLQVHKNDFWISRQYRIDQNQQQGTYRIKGHLLYQICSQRICSLPLKSYFDEKITISNR